jgi:LytS/YehU family sensor histidine kinase
MLAILYIVLSFLYGLIGGLALASLTKRNRTKFTIKKKWVIYTASAVSMLIISGVLGEINKTEIIDEELRFSSILIILTGLFFGLYLNKCRTKLLL